MARRPAHPICGLHARRDLLILSAGLKEPFPAGTRADLPVPVKAPNTWMLALGERFHLASGNCLDSTIPAERRPRVHVNIVEPVVGLPKSLQRRTDERIPDFTSADIQPIAALPWPPIVSLSDLERKLSSSASPLQREGSTNTAEQHPSFAKSDWPARLKKAERLFRDVEFLTPWPDGAGREMPAIRGMLDFLWKEPDGWHVLLLTDGERWTPAGQALAVRVVEQQFDEPPRSVRVFNVRTGASSNERTAADMNSAWSELELMLKKANA